MPNRLPLAVQTLYADLSQKLRPGAPLPGSISRRTIHGTARLYSTERHGAKRVQRHLGHADDPVVVQQAEAIRREARLARERRNTIAMLKAAGVQGPSQDVGRVLEAMSRAALFDRGMVLVGTIAYQIYPCVLGCWLEASAMVTQDADFVAATTSVSTDVALAVGGDGASGTGAALLSILRLADPSFAGAPTLDRLTYPCRFVSEAGLDVELLTPVRRRDEPSPVPLPGLKASAMALPFLEYLVEGALPAVVLYGSGVRVTVPQPARYAVHKLIVAQRRQSDSVKRGKDLMQAQSIIARLREADPDTLGDALADARRRGPAWREGIAASLKVLGSNV